MSRAPVLANEAVTVPLTMCGCSCAPAGRANVEPSKMPAAATARADAVWLRTLERSMTNHPDATGPVLALGPQPLVHSHATPLNG